MFCRQCRSQIDDDSAFCKACGARQGTTAGPGPEPAGPFASPPMGPTTPAPERELWRGRRSAKRYVPWYTLAAVVMIAGLWAAVTVDPAKAMADWPAVGPSLAAHAVYVRLFPVAAVLVLLAGVWLRALLFVHGEAYRLTSERFFFRRGILVRHTDEMELIRVNDVTVRQNLLERLLGIGTVTVFSNDKTTPVIAMAALPGPEAVKEHIRGAAALKRKSGVYVANI
ncbi:MAG: PH domain-containing protein [Planctomycetota bacterium]